MTLGLDFICGLTFGLEYLNDENEDGTPMFAIILSLGVFRIIYVKEYNEV